MLLLASCSKQPEFVSVAPEPTHYAWWLRVTYNPFGKAVRGIPIEQISSDWCYANEFSLDLFLPEYMNDISRKPQFSVESTFGQKTKLTTLVGAFETCGHKKGLFILVIEQQMEKSVVRFLEQYRDMNGIPHLYVTERDTVDLWWCYDCDHSNELAWDAKTNKFIWRNWEDDADDAQPTASGDTPSAETAKNVEMGVAQSAGAGDAHPADAAKRIEAGEAQPGVAGDAAPKSGAAPLN